MRYNGVDVFYGKLKKTDEEIVSVGAEGYSANIKSTKKEELTQRVRITSGVNEGKELTVNVSDISEY